MSAFTTGAKVSLGEADEDPLLALDVLLDDVSQGEENTFRTQNASLTDFERRNVIERTGDDVQTRVILQEVTHGTYNEDGDEATLLVFCFRFDPHNIASRVARAFIKIEFFASAPDSEAPTVDKIAPEGHWTVSPTADEESVTRGGELGLGASIIVDASAKATVTKTTTRQVSDGTTITGSINLGSGKNMGESTVAAWNLLENRHRKSGVSKALTVAILLRRFDSQPFSAKVTLEADCDFRTGLKQKFRKFPLDDPVLFNPRNTSTKAKKGRHYGVEKLGEVDIGSLCKM